jgi:flagella basal body P-ring formation protein FlgA
MEPQQLAEALLEYVARTCDVAEARVEWLGVPEARWPATDDAIRFVGDACRERPDLRAVWLGDDGERSLWLRPVLSLWVDVPVAAADTPAGSEVEATLARVPWRDARGATRTEGVARVDLAAGTPLTDGNVAPRVDAVAGAPVVVAIRRGALSISSEGRLLQDARAGEPVQVATASTRVVLSGILVEPGLVEVR